MPRDHKAAIPRSVPSFLLYVFVYPERIKPGGELPRLQFSASAAHEPIRRGEELVTINITLKNTI
jgi:hypothetical protein